MSGRRSPLLARGAGQAPGAHCGTHSPGALWGAEASAPANRDDRSFRHSALRALRTERRPLGRERSRGRQGGGLTLSFQVPPRRAGGRTAGHPSAVPGNGLSVRDIVRVPPGRSGLARPSLAGPLSARAPSWLRSPLCGGAGGPAVPEQTPGSAVTAAWLPRGAWSLQGHDTAAPSVEEGETLTTKPCPPGRGRQRLPRVRQAQGSTTVTPAAAKHVCPTARTVSRNLYGIGTARTSFL